MKSITILAKIENVRRSKISCHNRDRSFEGMDDSSPDLRRRERKHYELETNRLNPS